MKLSQQVYKIGMIEWERRSIGNRAKDQNLQANDTGIKQKLFQRIEIVKLRFFKNSIDSSHFVNVKKEKRNTIGIFQMRIQYMLYYSDQQARLCFYAHKVSTVVLSGHLQLSIVGNLLRILNRNLYSIYVSRLLLYPCLEDVSLFISTRQFY